MTEPSAARPTRANATGLGPPGLLRWPARLPLNQRPDARPEPLRDPGGALDGQPIELPDVVPQGFHPRTAAVEPVAESEDAPPARRGISVPATRQEPVAKPATAPEGRPLGRPGPPALAGAAIAGLLLVVAPLALSALQRPETLATVPVTAGVGLRAEGPESGAGGAGGGQQESENSAGTDTPGGGPPADAQPERGYVPEAVPQEGAGTAGSGGQPQNQSQGEGNGGGQTGDSAVSGSDGSLAAGGGPQSTAEADSGKQESESGGGGDGGGEPAPEGGDAPADGTKGESDGGSGGGGGGGKNGDPDQGDAPAADSGDAAAPMMAGPSPSGAPEGEDTPAGAASPEAAPSPSTSSSGPAFTALAGPGCPAVTGASYGTAGRGADAAGWATRDGGYGLDGCDGGYDAIPVSGTAEYGDGRYAYWSFTPGFADARCDIYVYVPEDASPQWVTDREAMYQIFPGPEPSGSAAAVFGVRQAESKGGWVKVTGFVSPTERFTVQLTNIGEDAVAGGATSHVAASAVRTSCT